jgi:hypothetical protein
MLRRVAVVRTDVSEEHIASIIRVVRATTRNNSQDSNLHSHRRENLKSYRVIVVLKNNMVGRALQAFGFPLR